MLLMIYIPDKLSNSKITEIFIILFILGKLNSRISMYRFVLTFLFKKYKSTFNFSEMLPKINHMSILGP